MDKLRDSIPSCMHYSLIYFCGVIQLLVDEGCWQGNWVNYIVTLSFHIAIHFIIIIHTYGQLCLNWFLFSEIIGFSCNFEQISNLRQKQIDGFTDEPRKNEYKKHDHYIKLLQSILHVCCQELHIIISFNLNYFMKIDYPHFIEK